jgi:hypothetical protein
VGGVSGEDALILSMGLESMDGSYSFEGTIKEIVTEGEGKALVSKPRSFFHLAATAAAAFNQPAAELASSSSCSRFRDGGRGCCEEGAGERGH